MSRRLDSPNPYNYRMRTIFTSVLFAASLVVLAGCSSTHAKIEKGAITARTFSFVNTAGKPAPRFVESGQDVHVLVQNAITQSLARRQVGRVEQDGDITVAYLIITGNNATTTAINDYFGYGGDAPKLSQMAHEKYTSTKNPNYFEAGTLLIDLIDKKSRKVVWRNYTTRALRHDLSLEARAARLNEAVEEILARARFRQ